MRSLYNAARPLARGVFTLLANWNPKIREGMLGRDKSKRRLLQLANKLEGQCIWIHASSVGEYEQARPIARDLQKRHPELPILHTFFSPSGYNYAENLGEAKYFEYLVDDSPSAVREVLQALRPLALVFVKFDLWPNLVHEAATQKIPLFLVNATLQPRSWRSRWPASSMYRTIYEQMNFISAVSLNDAERFKRISPRQSQVFVDGDTRFDQVVRRRQQSQKVPLPGVLQQPKPQFTFIAGSTWKPDEEAVLQAWAQFVHSETQTFPGEAPLETRLLNRLYLVPHEPTENHLRQSETLMQRLGLNCIRYSNIQKEEVTQDVILLDRVGFLAELYEVADAAYVGGAFTSGVHNLMEPAIMGVPIYFGPKHENAPEAQMLLEAGAAGVITCAADLLVELQRITESPSERAQMGRQARHFVESNLGAAKRCTRRLLESIEIPSPSAKEFH